MDVTKFDNAKEYYQTVKGYLSQDEATNCLPLGVARVLCNSQPKDTHLPYLVTVENNREIVATAIQTPPRRLLLAKSKSLEAIKLIAENTDTYFAKVDKDYTSQICPNCGTHTGKKDLSVRVHSCNECGYTQDRDVTASEVVRNRGLEAAGTTVYKQPSNGGLAGASA